MQEPDETKDIGLQGSKVVAPRISDVNGVKRGLSTEERLFRRPAEMANNRGILESTRYDASDLSS